MLVIRQFQLDKNFILRQAQSDLKEDLCHKIVKITTSNYLAWENPLGLVDDFVLLLKKNTINHTHLLYPVYDYLAFVYRFQNPGNQLEFLWDGKTHYDKFSEEWSAQLESWIILLGQKTAFNKLVLKSCAIPNAHFNPFTPSALLRIAQTYFEIKPLNKGRIRRTA